jgi:hypothetical protein
VGWRRKASSAAARQWRAAALELDGTRGKTEVGSGCAYISDDAHDEVEGEASGASASQLVHRMRVTGSAAWPSLARVLTVKIRQPSHEFTFGVGMTFVSYPVVLTPVA